MEKMQKERADREAAWKASCLSVEELLCLQLLGYSSQQIINWNEPEYNEQLRRTAKKAIRELDKAKRILDRQTKAGVITIPYYADDYPRHLKYFDFVDIDLADILLPSPLIHVSGNLKLLNREDTVIITGVHTADVEGIGAAYRFAKQIGEQGHVVISGLGLGCDAAAHRGCLDAEGQTIAIVASGLDVTHPKVNRSLQEEIVAKGGIIVSEHPFGVRANPTRLVTRCRMQVLLTESLIVVQCPIISESMYAAWFAEQLGRDFYGRGCNIHAVKYDIWNTRNSGNKFLLDYHGASPLHPEQDITLDEYYRLKINQELA